MRKSGEFWAWLGAARGIRAQDPRLFSFLEAPQDPRNWMGAGVFFFFFGLGDQLVRTSCQLSCLGLSAVGALVQTGAREQSGVWLQMLVCLLLVFPSLANTTGTN